jgi:uncharacterized damage-inducible protein DinB
MIALCALILAAGAVASADHHGMNGEIAKPGAAYAKNLTDAGGKAVDLVAAMPAESFGWSPAEGVRTVSEAAMHLASANYYFASRIGTPAPEGIDLGGMASISDKEQVVSTLRASVEHLEKAFEAVTDVSGEVDIFGNPGTTEDMMLIAIGHVHEHLGQLIAYARSNGVTPPWSK